MNIEEKRGLWTRKTEGHFGKATLLPVFGYAGPAPVSGSVGIVTQVLQ